MASAAFRHVKISSFRIICKDICIDNISLTTGKNLYMSKCGGCHQLFDPNSYTKVEWNKIMLAMQEKSKINDQQKNEILNWIFETQQSTKNLEAKK